MRQVYLPEFYLAPCLYLPQCIFRLFLWTNHILRGCEPSYLSLQLPLFHAYLPHLSPLLTGPSWSPPRLVPPPLASSVAKWETGNQTHREDLGASSDSSSDPTSFHLARREWTAKEAGPTLLSPAPHLHINCQHLFRLTSTPLAKDYVLFTSPRDTTSWGKIQFFYIWSENEIW